MRARRAFGFNDDGTVRESEAVVVRELTKRLLAGESQDRDDRGPQPARNHHQHRWASGVRTGLRQTLARPRQRRAHHLRRRDSLPRRPAHRGRADLGAGGRNVRGEASGPSDLERPTSAPGSSPAGICGHRLPGRARKNMKPYDGRRGSSASTGASPARPPRTTTGCGRISVDQRELDPPRRRARCRHPGRPEARRRRRVRDQGHRRRPAEPSRPRWSILETLGRAVGRPARPGRDHPLPVDAATAPLDRRLTELRHRLDELAAMPEADVPPEVVAASRTEWGQRWESATVAERRTLLRLALRGRRLSGQPGRPDSAEEVRPDSGRRRLTRYD